MKRYRCALSYFPMFCFSPLQPLALVPCGIVIKHCWKLPNTILDGLLATSIHLVHSPSDCEHGG